MAVDTHPDLQLSCELMDAIYSHDFDTRSMEPKRLMQCSVHGIGWHFYDLVGKDDGHMYSFRSQLHRSLAALALPRSGASLAEVYARMPLEMLLGVSMPTRWTWCQK